MGYKKRTDRQRNPNKFFNTLTQEYEPILYSDELYERIKNIPDTTKNRKFKALFSVLYMTGARANEIVLKFKPNQIKYINRGTDVYVHLKDIFVSKKSGTLYFRTIPLLLEYWEKWLKFVYDYIKHSEDLITYKDTLFNFSGREALRRANELLGWNVHRFRHTRATNLMREDGYNEAMLREFFGWSTTTNIARYTHSSIRDLERFEALKKINSI